MYDLAIAYRIYPGVSKVPAFYPDNKFRMSKMCLRSFQRALGRLRVKIFAILDGCPPEYVDLFRTTLENHELEIIQRDGVGNLPTFSIQVDLLTEQKEAEYVFFAEDDYFYLPDALEKMLHFMRRNTDADFVTPYDHPDSYLTSSGLERSLVRPFDDRYWRTVSSTCLTFLTSRANLLRTQSLFRTYGRGNMDCPIWLALTQKTELANPRVHAHDLFRAKTWLKTWYWGYRALLFGKRYRLWAPLPALATHMESTCLSPLIDWRAQFESFETQAQV